MTRLSLALRNLAFTIVVPGSGGVYVPWLILRHHGASPAAWYAAPAIAVGVVLYLWCVLVFSAVGRGTPGVWDPPRRVVAAGLASWSGGEIDERKLIVRGQAHLLEDLKALADLERVRLLFDDLETRREVIDLLGRTERAEGVRIFIGSENKLFSLSGSSTIIAPYHDASGRIVGVLGVIGPTRLNYARVIPMVDYTAKVVSKLLGG